MAVQVFISSDSNPDVVQAEMNGLLARLPDQDVKNVQMSSHVTVTGLVHVGRITYQEDEE